jgi:hypothetical protein
MVVVCLRPWANLSLKRDILYLLIVQILELLLQFAFGMVDVTCWSTSTHGQSMIKDDIAGTSKKLKHTWFGFKPKVAANHQYPDIATRIIN